eukprot:6490902-Lingulodinium_polyedra.AAC.1
MTEVLAQPDAQAAHERVRRAGAVAAESGSRRSFNEGNTGIGLPKAVALLARARPGRKPCSQVRQRRLSNWRGW